MSILNSILSMAAKALDLNGQSSAHGAANTGAAKTATTPTATPTPTAIEMSAEDRAAIKRYDYLLKTADPEQLEQVHLEAFARLTPIQREEVNAQLRAELPAGEYPASSSAADLARSATRSEARNPGFLGNMFVQSSGRGGAGILAGVGIGTVAGVGIGAAGGLLAAVAGGAVLSSVAAPLLEQAAGLGVDFESITGGLAGTLEGGLEGVTAGVGETVSGLGAQLSELGSNFEIPGLGGLGNLFGRN